ncbi:MAG: methionine--tRNA ligase [Myxococcaceae bacterium]
MAERVLVTSALPYANGPIHIGHLVEYVQTDIYVRFLRSCGQDVIYVCADDTHGTPIELNAAKAGLTPEAFIARFYEQHQSDFRDFDVKFDTFGSTNAPENKQYAEQIYNRLKEAGEVDRREIEQTYCEKDKRFLPDRFVKGTCPNCRAADQYGDVCEKCGKTYAPTDLIKPYCSLCGTPPIRKKSAHLFFKLSKQADFLLELIRKPEFINQGVANQLQQFFEKGLADWDISRDGPYFGFSIPGETDKYFYVWLDAPIGYISSTERWAKQTGKVEDALAYWAADSNARIVHFIGKDIVYFHALFWPAVLKVAKFKGPDRLVIHGHLTVNGQKMSKSRSPGQANTLVNARTYLDRVGDPSYLRYFYAANLGSGPEDIDLSLQEFRLRVNAELVNNIGNLANRALSLLATRFEKKLAPASSGAGKKLVEEALAKAGEVRAAFERLEYRAAVKQIAEISQSANQFLQNVAPWNKIKTDVAGAHADLSDAAEVTYLVAGLLAPIVPRISTRLFEQLGAPELTFTRIAGSKYPLLDRNASIGTPAVVIARLEEAPVTSLIEADDAGAAASQVSAGAGGTSEEIDFEQFAKVQLRVGKVLAAERIPKADKLLKLTVDLGEGTPRTIASGIAASFAPEQLVGRNVMVVANLKPRAIRGVESRGMLLTAGVEGEPLKLVDPGDVPPGTEVK